jgi:UDP-glucose 4-epimerase
MSQKEKILVTGGAGFVGSHLVDELVEKGHDIVVLDDLSGGFDHNVNNKATFVQGSINDAKLIDELFETHGFTYVYHLAAYAAEGLSHFIRRFNYENNLIGSINLINASIHHKIKCFIFTSSIAVYGKNQTPMVESLTPAPEDPYGVAKFAVELDLKAAHELFGLNYVIFRPHNVYGERQHIGDRYRNVIGIFINNTLKGLPVPVFGDGLQQRAFTHVKDVVPLMAQVVERTDIYQEVFNIGADTPYTINQLVEYVSEAMQIDKKVEYLPARNEVVIAYADHSKIKKAFPDYEPKINLKEGVKSMVEWAKERGPQESTVFENIEITENLPPSWAAIGKK